ncbi:PadR family transcriptional regulator [Humibacter albus]|jgi:DNA-binding PadR family transcriptional regulator|uniref:PadR family transcriptional regulator n=1 Tax=Humibacter albus TaxID=427754 RepID=UPI0003B368CC|nr:PadR family transcriptional regulator [Humibacter albus]
MRDEDFMGDAPRRHGHGGHPRDDRECWGRGPQRFHHDEPGAHHHGAPHEAHGFDGPSRGEGYGRRGFGPSFDPRGFDPAFMAAFGARGRKRASRGDIRSAILSLLADGSQNGYSLIKAIAERTDGLWKPSPGSVYPTLQQLVDEELVEATGDGRRTDYELTDAGTAYVAEHQSELDAAWQAAPGLNASGAALHQSIGKLMGVVQQFRFAATDEQRAQAAEKIDELRKALYLILAE